MDKPLQNLASVDSVKNVYLFIADSVRAQTMGDRVASLGVSGRAIAPSTFTGSSWPSILSGMYPTSHRVWDFQDRLARRPLIMRGPENLALDAGTIWTELPPDQKPPFKIIGATQDEARSLLDTEPPFICIEHHKGGHAPYGFPFDEFESVAEFYESHRPSVHELPHLYEKGVKDAEDTFLQSVEYLDEECLLDDTLVIFTSDHGEALGEPRNGMAIGHGHPMTPDVVNVPVVFAGAGLPDTELGSVISGTDIAPTSLRALNRGRARRSDGTELWTSTPEEDRLCRSEVWKRIQIGPTAVNKYVATSVWDEAGGIVIHFGSRLKRVALTLGPMMYRYPESYLYRDFSRPRRWSGFVKKYLPATVRHGNPRFSTEEARAETCTFELGESFGHDAIDEGNLQKLGYID